MANKLDLVHRRADLLPWLQALPQRHAFAEYVPMSAERSADVERLLDIIEPHLPEQAWTHDPDALTDRNERFLAGEIVREKLFRLTGDELPYTSTVVLDRFEEWDSDAPTQVAGHARRRQRRVHIAATIVVERDAHKAIVIGQGGERLKRIGTEARHELQHLLDARVHWRCGCRCARAGPTTSATCAVTASNEFGPGEFNFARARLALRPSAAHGERRSRAKRLRAAQL